MKKKLKAKKLPDLNALFERQRLRDKKAMQKLVKRLTPKRKKKAKDKGIPLTQVRRGRPKPKPKVEWHESPHVQLATGHRPWTLRLMNWLESFSVAEVLLLAAAGILVTWAFCLAVTHG